MHLKWDIFTYLLCHEELQENPLSSKNTIANQQKKW